MKSSGAIRGIRRYALQPFPAPWCHRKPLLQHVSPASARPVRTAPSSPYATTAWLSSSSTFGAASVAVILREFYGLCVGEADVLALPPDCAPATAHKDELTV